MAKQQVFYGCRTDVGNKRVLNEDAFKSCPELGLWIIADGMGGHEGGEIASKMVVEHVSALVGKGCPLDQSIYSAHEAILNAAKTGVGKRGMGTTVVALKIEDDHKYQIAWVGDSRAYLCGRGHLVQLSRDHSVVQELIDRGEITREEAMMHPARNVITQALGSTEVENLLVEKVSGNLQKGHSVLLCTDGLTTEVTEIEIKKILDLPKSTEDKTDLLVQAALNGGGHDNVTAILVSMGRQRNRFLSCSFIHKLYPK